ncbi:sugar ABC transporter permease [Vallitalea longa]|uniref:Sugar ABC transporter permease n=1 Tax=Vallitalea longa TaxID=2936439 RepID=A0A9W5YBQ5_9FIRM|nr:carbohydrate ABC transporter permease [Vallitalea longa]GKX30179.1 sugar ABC transporter permease [Vallitalea longa]
MKTHRLISKTINILILSVLAIIFLIPFYIVFTGSFKGYQEIFSNVFNLPKSLHYQNYMNAWNKLNLLPAMFNSLVVSVGSIIGLVFISSMAAYRIQRVQNRFHKTLYFIFVASMTIPFPAVMLPLLKQMSVMHLNNTKLGLIICYFGFGVAFATFLYHGFLKSIPRSIEEAATIDGCSTFGVYSKIIFPLLKPTTVTLIVLDVLWFWNDYVLPSIMLSGQENRTVPLAISYLFDQFSSQWDMAMAAIMLSLLPVLVVFIFLQKYIVSGIAAGSVKG